MSGFNQIWLSIDNSDGSIKEGFQIPYNPSEYQLTEGTNEKSVNIAGLGNVTVKNGKSPMTLSFSSFFSPYVESGLELENEGDLLSPMEYDTLLRKWKNGSSPVHLLITNTNINSYFSISTYTTKEQGGAPGTIQYSLSLKQYGSGTGAQSGNGNGVLVRRIDSETYVREAVPTVYYVQKNDTLQSIAERYYGDCQMVYEIYKLNTALLKNGVNTKLKKGWTLNMPSGWIVSELRSVMLR